MLVLSRKRNEVVDLYFKNNDGETSTVSCTVIDFDKHRVKLGFNAKDQVKIMRKEIENGPPSNYFAVDKR